MQPHDPTRRRLLGGLVAGLFGWLLPRKAQAKPLQPSPAAGHTSHITVEQSDCLCSSTTFSAQGQIIAFSEPVATPVTTTTTTVRDSQNRLVSTTISY